jgi:hypothetical protein
MKHCPSIWQDHDDIHSVELRKLSAMSWHDDNRWYWRDLPRIMDYGLWYPVLYFKITTEFWNTSFKKRKGDQPMWPYINPPKVNDDDMIWGVYMGTNRLTCLRFMSYTSVDAIECKDQASLIKLGIYLRDEDPLHNG